MRKQKWWCATVKRKSIRRRAVLQSRTATASSFAAPLRTLSTKLKTRPAKMTGTTGTRTAITSFRTHRRGIARDRTIPARAILMHTAAGFSFPATAGSGNPIKMRPGRRITMDVGCGNRTGAGPGFHMSLGAGRPITMAAGFSGADRGCGGRGRHSCAQYGGRLSLPSLDLVITRDLHLALEGSAGSQLVHLIPAIAGGGGASTG